MSIVSVLPPVVVIPSRGLSPVHGFQFWWANTTLSKSNKSSTEHRLAFDLTDIHFVEAQDRSDVAVGY